jgi:hypothetical protein
MANSCPNYLDVQSNKPLAYLLEFGLLTQLGHPSVDDRPNYGLNEFRGTCAVAPKSEQ